MRRHILKLLIIFGFGGYTLLGCGQIHLGQATPNDNAPTNAVIVAQGSFTGENQKTVSGVAVIYRDIATSTHIIRLEGISTPSESNLAVQAKANSAVVFSSSLRASSGTQNYATSVTGTPQWNSVIIHSITNNLDYGTALLTSR